MCTILNLFGKLIASFDENALANIFSSLIVRTIKSYSSAVSDSFSNVEVIAAFTIKQFIL